MFRDEAMDAFLDWLRGQQHKIHWPKVALQLISDATGYGLFARENIRLGETVIQVPEELMISAGMVANIAEYATILGRHRLEPAEVLALFFCFERVYLDCFCAQPADAVGGDGPTFLVQWSLEVPDGFKQFMEQRRKREAKAKRRGDFEDQFWWRPYLGVLPCHFGTPLFRHFDDEQHLRQIAQQLPQQAKDKLLGQLTELKALERKLFDILYPSSSISSEHQNGDLESLEHRLASLDLDPQSVVFWREMCCWAWHIVNTRCIFVDNLPFHPLVDSQKRKNSDADAPPPNRRFSDKRKAKRKLRRKSEDAEDTDGEEEEAEGDFGGSLALIPLIDMLNHSADAQCVAMFDRKHSRRYMVRADQHSVRAGDQLYVCYGAHDNSRLWVEYGFRMTDDACWNPFNRVHIPLDLFIALAERSGARVSDTRREVLRKADLACTIYATDEEPSFALRKCCSILLLERQKLSNWSRYIFADDANGDGGDNNEETGDNDHEERRLLGAILQRLEAALERRRAAVVADADAEDGDNGDSDGDCAVVAALWQDQIDIVRKMRTKLMEEDGGEGQK